jgi:antitoxin CptB
MVERPADQSDPTDESLRRLRWQCRRGMLELDHLLLGFLEQGYRDLDPAGRAEFLELLGEQDQDLSDWFMSRRLPQDPKTAALVDHILAVAGVAAPAAR